MPFLEGEKCYIWLEMDFRGVFSGGCMAKADLCLFWKVGSVIYGQRQFFEKNSVVAVAKADLCLFWKVGSVIYGLEISF